MSQVYNEKSTQRFTFAVNRNTTAKRAGSNTVVIATNPIPDSQYSVGQTSLTMTVVCSASPVNRRVSLEPEVRVLYPPSMRPK